jgi:hypothetical protein
MAELPAVTATSDLLKKRRFYNRAVGYVLTKMYVTSSQGRILGITTLR